MGVRHGRARDRGPPAARVERDLLLDRLPGGGDLPLAPRPARPAGPARAPRRAQPARVGVHPGRPLGRVSWIFAGLRRAQTAPGGVAASPRYNTGIGTKPRLAGLPSEP